MRHIHGRTAWRAFLRGRAKTDAGASLLLRIGGKCPSETGRLIQNAIAAHKIDAQSYAARMDILDRVRNIYETPAPREMPTPSDDWNAMGNGGHMRRNHLGSEY